MKPIYSIAVCTLLLLSSCQQSFYVADKVNSPGFKKAGEAKLDLSARPQTSYQDGAHFSYSADAAYAPINHLGIIASYRVLNNKVNREAYAPAAFFATKYRYAKYNGQRGDIGAGYFTRIGRKAKYEAYAGYGNGTLKADISYDSTFSPKPSQAYTTSYNRFFIQSAVGMSNNYFSIMGGCRYTLHKYYNFKATDPTLKNALIPNSTQDFTKKSFGFVEPYFEVQVGYKYVKFNYQIGFPFQANGPSLAGVHGAPYMSFGILMHYDPGFFLPKKLVRRK